MIKEEVIPEQKDINNDAVIVLKNITKKFGGKLVLDNLSLSIEKGKTTVIIGPSGCGKTVLIKHMIILLRPTSGQIYFKGMRIDDLSERQIDKVRTHFGFLFQAGALFDSLNVSENIIFPITQHEKITDWKAVDELVKHKLAMVGLDGYQNYNPANPQLINYQEQCQYTILSLLSQRRIYHVFANGVTKSVIAPSRPKTH